jgi:hypothetical protein
MLFGACTCTCLVRVHDYAAGPPRIVSRGFRGSYRTVTVPRTSYRSENSKKDFSHDLPQTGRVVNVLIWPVGGQGGYVW